MAENPEFSVKVTPELKEKVYRYISEAKADFNTNKEWFENLISLYELHILKRNKGTNRYTDDLDSISLHLRRIQELIVHVVKKSADVLTDQESTWKKGTDELKQQLQNSNEARSTMSSQLTESIAQANQSNAELSKLQKQFGVHEELNATLTKSLQERDSEIETLRKERNQWNSFDYPAELQRIKDENQSLNQQLQNQQHQITLMSMEFEHKLELEQFKTEMAKHEVEMLIQRKQRNTVTDPSASKKRESRTKDHSRLQVSSQPSTSPTELVVEFADTVIERPSIITSDDEHADDHDDNQIFYFPKQDEYLQDQSDNEQTDNDVQQSDKQPKHESEQASTEET